MHYQNGREAKQGDVVLHVDPYGSVTAGVLFNLNAGSDSCNGIIAPMHNVLSCITVGNCLHIDDVKAFAKLMPDQRNPQPKKE